MMWDDLWGNLGDSDWWLGENSLFGSAMESIGAAGIDFSLYGTNIGSGSSGSDSSSSGSMEADILKYGIIAVAAYMIISPTLK